MSALLVGNSFNEYQSINLPDVYLDPPHPNTLVHSIQGGLAGAFMVLCGCIGNYIQTLSSKGANSSILAWFIFRTDAKAFLYVRTICLTRYHVEIR